MFSRFPRPSVLPPPGATVLVGLSGGVDSAVTAALLLKWGYRVKGVTLRLFDGPKADVAEADTHRVGKHLGIPVSVVDGRQTFEALVIRPFVEAYGANRTPSPCCVCNPGVKFRLLSEMASQWGAQAIATGHYVRKEERKGVVVLKAAADRSRDQSYFLYGLTDTQLERAFFPLGEASKPLVRELAEALNIPVSARPDSQDLCFLDTPCKGHRAYAEFVKAYAGTHHINADGFQPGSIIDLDQNVLGQHSGTYLYTIGQRRGLGISGHHPLYVFNLKDNRVIVGPRKRITSLCVEAWHDTPLARHGAPQRPLWAQFRSTMVPTPVSIKRSGKTMIVHFVLPQHGAAPGQVLVLRTEDTALVGGGIISAESSSFLSCKAD